MAEYPAGGLEYHAINIIAQGRKEHTRQRIIPPHQQQARHGEKVHPFPFLLFHSRFHSGGDHQRAHGQGQDQRADKLNRWVARYFLSIIPSIQRAIPMHGTATTSPMPGRGRWAQGRGAHPCQVSGTTPYGDGLMVGHPARPLFFVIFKNRFRIMYFSQYINIYAINGLVNQQRKIL